MVDSPRPVDTTNLCLAPSQKRAKDTSSGPGISPSILKAQSPRKKRPVVGKPLSLVLVLVAKHKQDTYNYYIEK